MECFFVIFCEDQIRGSDAFAGCGGCAKRNLFAQERDVANRGSVKSSRDLQVTNSDAECCTCTCDFFFFFETGVDCCFDRIMGDSIPKYGIGGLLTTARADGVNLRVGERGHYKDVGRESQRALAKERNVGVFWVFCQADLAQRRARKELSLDLVWW